MIILEAAWRHRLACAGEAACRPAVECYRRRQTTKDVREQNNAVPRTLCVRGRVLRLTKRNRRWFQRPGDAGRKMRSAACYENDTCGRETVTSPETRRTTNARVLNKWTEVKLCRMCDLRGCEKCIRECVTDKLNPVHTSNNVEATLSNATMSNVASTLLLVWTGLQSFWSMHSFTA